MVNGVLNELEDMEKTWSLKVASGCNTLDVKYSVNEKLENKLAKLLFEAVLKAVLFTHKKGSRQLTKE
jgi:hypothetical protein